MKAWCDLDDWRDEAHRLFTISYALIGILFTVALGVGIGAILYGA